MVAVIGRVRRGVEVLATCAALAAIPAYVVAQFTIDVPAVRARLDAEVCGPDARIVFRIRMTGSGRHQSGECRTADGTVTREGVILPMLWAAQKRTWPPATALVAVVWGWVALTRARRSRSGAATVAEGLRFDGSGDVAWSADDVAAALRALRDLRGEGLIPEDEFERRRDAILERL